MHFRLFNIPFLFYLNMGLNKSITKIYRICRQQNYSEIWGDRKGPKEGVWKQAQRNSECFVRLPQNIYLIWSAIDFLFFCLYVRENVKRQCFEKIKIKISGVKGERDHYWLTPFKKNIHSLFFWPNTAHIALWPHTACLKESHECMQFFVWKLLVCNRKSHYLDELWEFITEFNTLVLVFITSDVKV